MKQYSFGQNTIGIPGIINYTKQTYNAGTQNWGIAQDQNGIIYFANNQGLLSFDGTWWRLYPLPNKTIVRSVAIGSKNRIYVGGQSEFGFFAPGKNGELEYTSLMPLLNEEAKDFTDVWNINVFGNKVFFRAYRKIFEYDERKIKVYNGLHWNFLGAAGSSLLAFEYNKGLVQYNNGQWNAVAKTAALSPDINIKSAINFGKDSILLVTLTHGLFILHKDSISVYNTKDIASIANQNIYAGCLLDAGHLALVTNLSGCVIIDKHGNFVQRFSKKEGIQNNNVLSVLLDRDKNLWLGLDNGIDLVRYSNAIKNIYPEPEDRNSGYASFKYKNKLYLGLASGAYVTSLDSLKDISYTNGNFQLVDGSKGQVWNFSEVNDQLLMGHNSGAFIIDGSKAIAIDPKTGFWGFQPLNNTIPSTWMIAGTYNGINFYQYREGNFFNPKLHAQFESARFVVRYKNEIWAAHPVKGLFRISFTDGVSPAVSLYRDKDRLLSPNHNKLFLIRGKMILVSDNGIFEYREKTGDFAHVHWMETVFGPSVSYVKEDQYGNIWFCRNRKIGVWDQGFPQPKIVYIPELNNRIQADGFENINILDSNNVLIAAEKGFFHINYALYKKHEDPLQVLLRSVRSISGSDSLVYGGYEGASKNTVLPFAMNSLRFQSSSLLFGQENTIEYSYYLDGFDKGWSEWSRRTEKDYTNIPPGRYTFKIKSRNNFTNESPVISYSFTVLPPWYRTWWAYLIYSFVFAAALYIVYKKQQRKYKKQQQLKLKEQQKKYDEEQKQLQMQHQLELSQTEKQIVQLQSEKLQAEVEHKNTELASSAMNLVHKVEILSKIKTDLIQFKEATQLEKGVKDFQKIIKVIDSELNQAQEWEQFARHFDNVHTDFLKKLKQFCPDLSASELKLAAYLRLSLSTKEIAQLMNISIRGVETSRYRLRKKLGLTNDEANLYEFLIQITSDKNSES